MEACPVSADTARASSGIKHIQFYKVDEPLEPRLAAAGLCLRQTMIVP